MHTHILFGALKRQGPCNKLEDDASRCHGILRSMCMSLHMYAFTHCVSNTEALRAYCVCIFICIYMYIYI